MNTVSPAGPAGGSWTAINGFGAVSGRRGSADSVRAAKGHCGPDHGHAQADAAHLREDIDESMLAI
jgi:hypothetical protein